MTDRYGVRSGGAGPVAAALGERLGLAFQERDSEYYGDYWLARVGEATIRVVPQPDPVGELLEPDFPDHPVLVYVDDDAAAAGIAVEAIAGLDTPGGVLERLIA